MLPYLEKRDFADVIEDLEMGDAMACLPGISVSTRVLVRRGQEGQHQGRRDLGVMQGQEPRHTHYLQKQENARHWILCQGL